MKNTWTSVIGLVLFCCFAAAAWGSDSALQSGRKTPNSQFQRAELTSPTHLWANWVAISGQTAVVPDCSGPLDIYIQPSGGWENAAAPNAVLRTSDGVAPFGVSMSGNTIIAQSNSAIYVWEKPAGGWVDMSSETAKLISSDGAEFNIVATSGNTIVAGAFQQTVHGVQDAGAAYVFVEPAGGWRNGTENAILTAVNADCKNGCYFGTAVAIDGETIVVGAPETTLGSAYDAGAVYIFVKPAGGWANMTQTAELTSANPFTEEVGRVVAIHGSTVVASTWAEVWALFVFEEPAGGWSDATQAAILSPTNQNQVNEFGLSLAVSGGGKIIMAGDPEGNNHYRGDVYVYLKPSGGWTNATQNIVLTANDGQPEDLFGQSISSSSNALLIAAPVDSVPFCSGKAYIFQ